MYHYVYILKTLDGFVKKSIIKDRYISCFINKDKTMIKSISFNHFHSSVNNEILYSNNFFDVLVKIKLNKWLDNKSTELQIIDIIKK